MVTAKMKVSRITPMGADNVEDAWATEIELTADYVGGANAEWAEATPQAVCRLTVTNKAAIERFPKGASMTVTFEQDQ